MAKKDIIVIGASAGGMDALQRVAAALPPSLQASIFVVWHLPPGINTILPASLAKAGPLPALLPKDGDPIERGRIYVAPPDHHMLVEPGYIRVTKGPKENRFRPAVDPLFRSAAYVYGARAVGVVLSGALDDGTAGLWTIKLRGGTAIVQDPADARHRSMPLNAMENVSIDHKLPAGEIGRMLGRLAAEDAPADVALPDEDLRKLEHEIRIAQEVEALEQHIPAFGELSRFTCPECHGVLTLLRDGPIIRFRCHTGHAHSAGSLLSSATKQVEDRLWDAVRALDETIMLLTQMGAALAKNGDLSGAEQCYDKAREAHQRAQPIREAALRNEALSGDEMLGSRAAAG